MYTLKTQSPPLGLFISISMLWAPTSPHLLSHGQQRHTKYRRQVVDRHVLWQMGSAAAAAASAYLLVEMCKQPLLDMTLHAFVGDHRSTGKQTAWLAV